MRLFLTTIAALLFVFVSFWIIRLWGESQTFPEYNHPMFHVSEKTVEFLKPSPAHVEEALKTKEFLYLDVAITIDQKMVIPKRKWTRHEKSIQYSTYEELKNDVLLLEDFKDSLAQKKIIFNLFENSQAAHENFFYNMKLVGLEKGETFIVVSPYEAPIKALKELAPSFVFGTTKPEILKIIAMGSMYLYEAAGIRADFIIHPLKIRNQDFYRPELLTEMARRHKRLIVGPMPEVDEAEAMKLKPYGVIIEEP